MTANSSRSDPAHKCTHKSLIGQYGILSTRRSRKSHELRAVGHCRGCGRPCKWWSRWDTVRGWRERVVRIDQEEYDNLIVTHTAKGQHDTSTGQDD